MDLTRAILFLGLVFHKALWEVLKRRKEPGGTGAKARVDAWLWGVKAVKVCLLLFLTLQTLFLEVLPIRDDAGGLRVIGLGVYLVGLAIAVGGRLQLGSNWKNLEDYGVLEEQRLVTSGIYRYIRHPIYTGDVMLLVGLELALNSWLVLGVALPVVVVVRQAVAEEGILAPAFPSYRAYCARTKRFIPFVV